MGNPKATSGDRKVAEVLVPLLATWPDEGMPAERLAAYAMVLADLDSQVLQAAVAHCLATCRFFPKPAEIRQAAFDLRALGQALPEPAAAWGEVVAEIGRVGSYGVPRFEHQLITDAVRYIGGWQRLCLSENMAADRARFIEAYTEVRRRHEVDVRMLPAVRDQVQLLAGRLTADRQLRAPEEKNGQG